LSACRRGSQDEDSVQEVIMETNSPPGNKCTDGPTGSRGSPLAMADIDLTEDLLDWGAVPTVQGGDAEDHGMVVGETNLEELLDWGVVPTSQGGDSGDLGIISDDDQNSVVSGLNWSLSQSDGSRDSERSWAGPHIAVGDIDVSMLSLEELRELEDRQRNERRQLRIAMLIKDRDRRKLVWELGNKALMKVETLMRMIKVDQAAE